jgi:MFS family permease
MAWVLTIVAMLVGGAVFWRWLSLDDFLKIVQPFIVALSIMAAGLLVRLNRGMPTLDWKSLEATDRKLLTGKIVELTREYLFVLAVQAVTLTAMLVLDVVASDPKRIPTPWQQPALAVGGALLALCVARMAYIVWRDHDIVKLQKKLIDDAADRDALKQSQEEALSTVAAIRAAGLQPGPKPEVSAWPN